MRRRTCQSCKAVNSKKLLPVPVQKQVAFAMLLVAVHLYGPGVLNAQFARHGPVIPASRSSATKKQTKLIALKNPSLRRDP